MIIGVIGTMMTNSEVITKYFRTCRLSISSEALTNKPTVASHCMVGSPIIFLKSFLKGLRFDYCSPLPLSCSNKGLLLLYNTTNKERRHIL